MIRDFPDLHLSCGSFAAGPGMPQEHLLPAEMAKRSPSCRRGFVVNRSDPWQDAGMGKYSACIAGPRKITGRFRLWTHRGKIAVETQPLRGDWLKLQ